jgi:hypothetical protein
MFFLIVKREEDMTMNIMNLSDQEILQKRRKNPHQRVHQKNKKMRARLQRVVHLRKRRPRKHP